jgi:glycosyltransferase involved in cell wall biosynthesis
LAEDKGVLKIAFIITGLSAGGAEIMLLQILERLDSRFSKNVISLTSLGEIGRKIQSLGINVEALGMTPRVPNPIALIKLMRIIRSLKPNVVHTWMYHSDLIGGIAARLAGIRSIAWSLRHSNLAPNLNKRSTLLVMQACAKLSPWIPQRIIACSETAQAAHIEAGYDANKISVIPNGFDLSRYKPDTDARNSVRAEFNLSQNAQLVGLIARYDPQKNHTGFLKAAAYIHRSRPDVHYLLVGKGVDNGNRILREEIGQAGLSSCVQLLGYREDIPRLMASLDVLASSSDGEAFPNVLGEAMACGIPCAATDAGDSSYIIGDTGQLAHTGDMIGLAEAIMSLLSMGPENRELISMQARSRIYDNFEISKVVKRYEAIYDQLASLSR